MSDFIWNGTMLCRLVSFINVVSCLKSLSGLFYLGKYAYKEVTGTGAYIRHYFTHVRNSSSSVQCLDFYYYITNSLNNANIIVRWSVKAAASIIVVVKALSQNKWQHIQINFTAPLSSAYDVSSILYFNRDIFRFLVTIQ